MYGKFESFVDEEGVHALRTVHDRLAPQCNGSILQNVNGRTVAKRNTAKGVGAWFDPRPERRF